MLQRDEARRVVRPAASHHMDTWVLVTDAQSRGGLSTVRSLGSKGIRVAAADIDRISIGFFSRYCARRLHYPDPAHDANGYCAAIINELGRHRYDLVMPLFEGTMFPLARRRREVEALARFPFLDYDRLAAGGDKAQAVEVAHSCGLRTPVTFEIEQESDVERSLAQLPLPVIVRPRTSAGSKGLHRVEHADKVWTTCEQVRRYFGPVIIQEYIPWGGFTYDVDILMNRDSLPRAAVVCKRIRTFPAMAGPTALGQAVHWPELADMAVSLLQRMHWAGPAEVEFRVDPRDNSPVFMEVNPRFWGSLHTGIVAGVDFPYLFYRMALDGDIPPVTNYRTDTRARYLFTQDLLCMATHPRRRTIVRAWLHDFVDPHTSALIPSWRDPGPLLGKCLASLIYGIRPDRRRLRLRRAVTV